MLSRREAGTLLIVLMIQSGLFAQSVPADSSALMNSEGAGMAQYADLNGYPGPKHALEMQEDLQLDDHQVKQMEAIFEEMAEKARVKGVEIIGAEERLHEFFLTKTASEESIRALSEEIGRLRGQLRAIHLAAHLQAAAVMSPEQRERYMTMRHGMDHHKH